MNYNNHTQEEVEAAKNLLLDAGFFGDLGFHQEDILEKYAEMRASDPERFPEEELDPLTLVEITSYADRLSDNVEGLYEYYHEIMYDAIDAVIPLPSDYVI